MKTFGKLLAVLGLITIIVLITLPAPSFQRTIQITNGFPTTVEVKCKTMDGRKAKTFKLEPDAQGKFVYFRGDRGGAPTVPVLVEAKVLSNGVTLSRQLELPVGSRSAGIGLSEPWFKSQDGR